MSDLIRILVFGTTGVGKTTICNALTGEDEPANDGVKGVTFQNHQTREFKIKDKEAVLMDTIGLNESSRGRVPSEKSLYSLIELLNFSQQGYNLLIHVLKKGRLTQIDENNYKLFVEIISQKKIPTIAVVTNCEDYDPMFKWLDKRDENDPDKLDNRTCIKNAGLEYDDIVCVGFAQADREALNEIFQKLWPLSADLIRTSILKHSEPQPIIIIENNSQLFDLLKRVWNSFIEFLNFPKKNNFILHVRGDVVKVMKMLGIKDEDIIKCLKPWNLLNPNNKFNFNTKNSKE